MKIYLRYIMRIRYTIDFIYFILFIFIRFHRFVYSSAFSMLLLCSLFNWNKLKRKFAIQNKAMSGKGSSTNKKKIVYISFQFNWMLFRIHLKLISISSYKFSNSLTPWIVFLIFFPWNQINNIKILLWLQFNTSSEPVGI